MKKLISLMMVIFSLNAYADKYDPKIYIPPQAYQYLPIIKEEVNKILPEFPLLAYFPALIEHESCITLKHSRCWNPKSELKTKRERGVGLSQLTVAFNTDGSVRFDTLSDLVRQNPVLLKELSWNNPYRPDLQIRAMVILTKTNFYALSKIPSNIQKIAMVDSAYNGGLGSLSRSRTICKLAENCDPTIWFNHVEKYCTKSKKVLYGDRSACDINIHHVRDVVVIRLLKYYNEFRKEKK